MTVCISHPGKADISIVVKTSSGAYIALLAHIIREVSGGREGLALHMLLWTWNTAEIAKESHWDRRRS